MDAWNGADGKSIAASASLSRSVEVIRKRPDTVDTSNLVAVGSRTARFRRKQQEKFYFVLLIILIIILLIVLIVISCYYVADQKRRICQTKECVRSASNLIMSMDQTVNPCEDFYQYACGNWAEDHPRPDFLSSFGWFTDKRRKVERMVRDILSTNTSSEDPLPLNQAKEMYAACFDTKTLDSLGVQPVIDFLASVGLPALPTFLNISKDSNTTTAPVPYKFDWLQTIIKVKKKMAMDVFIGFDIFPDSKNSSNKRLVLGEPSEAEAIPSYTELDEMLPTIKKRILFPERSSEALEADDKNEEKEDEETVYMTNYKIMYRGLIKEFIKVVNPNKLTEMTDEEMDKNVNATLKEHIRLSRLLNEIGEEFKNATVNKTSDEKSSSGNIFNASVASLQNETNFRLKNANFSSVEIWAPYLLGLFNNTNITLNFKNDTIMVHKYDYNYLMAMAVIIQGTDPLILELYIWFQVVDMFIPHTTTAMRDLYEKYMKVVMGSEGIIPRSLRCSSSVSVSMGMAVGYAIADKNFVNATLPKVLNMLHNIKMAFEDFIVSISWMDIPTKSASIEKVRYMKSLIGFPEWLFVPGSLEEYYIGVVTDPTKHIQNQLSLISVAFNNKLNYFRNPYVFNRNIQPTVVNAYHTFQANAISVPLVMLQYPFYDLGLEALNYGSIGTVLGHELTHGFDNRGRKFDKLGTYVQWWTNTTIDAFVNKTKCFVEQYSSFSLPEIDQYVNGNLTLGENIADYGGVRSALKGYWKESSDDKVLPGLTSLSSDQLFFLAYGNLWCGIRTPKSLSYEVKDVHTPTHMRVKGVLQNVPEFAKAWNCPANTTMNPARQRCAIF